MDVLAVDEITDDALDFARIRGQIADRCMTAEGREAVLSDPVLAQPAEVESLKRLVKPWLEMFVRAGDLPTSDFPPIAELLTRCAPEGARLDGPSLKAVARYLSSASGWKAFLAKFEGEGLSVWALRLPELSNVANELHRVLDDAGELIESAVPSLVRLRAELARDRSEIDQVARSLLRGPQWSDVWQDPTPTEKDGRTVLPLKANFRGRLEAVVHDSSASGQTLFVEPFALVERNNRLVEHQSAYRAEILRVLKELTERVREIRDQALSLVAALTELDRYAARAKWGYDHQGEFVVLGRPSQSWSLVRARHPLLGTSAVPIDLRVEPGVSVVLLSGPNTGGKTVSLKTVGLLSLLHQFGVPIPAGADSVLPVWDWIATDIGDHQSLDQALSTFSSHMNRMAQVLDRASPRSLVLLDEMASGTDPLEGGALGVAFLDHFLKTGVTVLATTHHGALKNYAFTHPGARNASVEFDESSGRPTYRILADVPGPSHALETAERMGIGPTILGRARQVLEGEESDVASVIKTLRQKQDELREREDTLAAKEREFREERRKTDLLALKLKQREWELKQGGLGEMNRFVSESRREFERLVKDIREGQLTAEKIKAARAFLDKTAAETDRQRQESHQELRELEAEESPAPPDSVDVAWTEGREVTVEPGRRPGTLVRKAGKGRWVVAIGSVKITVDEASLRAARSSSATPRVTVLSEGDVDRPAFQLDIRGLRWDDARAALERQVDRALLAGLQEFSIVHGTGEGVLQRAVQDYLRSRKDVKKFFYSHPEEGGFGKTVVQL